MKSSKTIMSQNFKELVVSSENLDKLHSVLLMMLKDVDFVCRKYNIDYFLCGGTLLGAIRHKGFIPWDDDVDIVLRKKDCIKIKEKLELEFANKYLVEMARSSVTDPSLAVKIYLKNTKFVEILSENWDKPKSIFLDIFPLEFLDESPKVRKIRGKLFDISAHLACLKVEYKFPSSTIKAKAKESKEVKKYFNVRRRLGFIANLFPMKFLYYVSRLQLKDNETNIVGLPSGIRYNREVFDKKVFSDKVEVEFEGFKFWAMKNHHEYLENLYGDYMKIPPIEKREVHIAKEIDFGEYDK